jgi:hypothetical protein
MAYRIKVPKIEFYSANNNGYVYGKFIARPSLFVYADLGTEKPYTPNPKDDPNAEYRLFVNCDLYFAISDESLDDEIYVSKKFGEVLIIYA